MTDNLNQNIPPELSEQDAELLSAYIDDMLTDLERQTLEQRLDDSPFLRDELRAMRQTVSWLNEMPTLKAPRNFTLTEADVANNPPPNIVIMPQKNRWFTTLTTAAAVIVVLVGVAIVAGTLFLSTPRQANLEMTGADSANENTAAQVAFANTDIPTATGTSTPLPTQSGGLVGATAMAGVPLPQGTPAPVEELLLLSPTSAEFEPPSVNSDADVALDDEALEEAESDGTNFTMEAQEEAPSDASLARNASTEAEANLQFSQQEAPTATAIPSQAPIVQAQAEDTFIVETQAMAMSSVAVESSPLPDTGGAGSAGETANLMNTGADTSSQTTPINGRNTSDPQTTDASEETSLTDRLPDANDGTLLYLPALEVEKIAPTDKASIETTLQNILIYLYIQYINFLGNAP